MTRTISTVILVECEVTGEASKSELARELVDQVQPSSWLAHDGSVVKPTHVGLLRVSEECA